MNCLAGQSAFGVQPGLSNDDHDDDNDNGSKTTLDADTSDLNHEVYLCLVWHGGFLGLAFYDMGSLQIHFMLDVQENDNFVIVRQVVHQIHPSFIVLNTIQDSRLLSYLHSIVSEIRVGHSGSSNDVCRLEFLPNVDFNFQVCKRRILALNLPSVSRHLSQDERFLYFSSLLPFGNANMISSIGGLLKYLEKTRVGIELESDVTQVPVLGFKIFIPEHHIQMDGLTFCALKIFETEIHPSTYKAGHHSAGKEGLSLYALLQSHVQSIPHSPVEEQPSTSTCGNLPILPKLYSPVKVPPSTIPEATIDCILAAPSPKKKKMSSKIHNHCPVSITCNNCGNNIILKKKDLIAIGRKRFIEHVKESDDNCFHFTGVPNVATLWYIYIWLLPFLSNITLGPGPKKTNKTRKALDLFEEFLLTLVRIRRGYDIRFLSFLFGVSTSHVSRIFNAWVKFLSDCFSDLIVWPTQEINKKNLPKCFKDFSRTIAIIDCTEYFVQKPLRPHAQRLTYSNYKHANTFKQLIAIMPTGCITFVSKLYAGNVSDQAIVKCCGLLEFLKPGDDLMADRGFNINHLVIAKKATLNIPAFSHGKCLSLKGVRKSRKIASVRIFVEHAIRRMKTFKLLSGILPLRLRFQLNSITKIVAFLSNLQKATIK